HHAIRVMMPQLQQRMTTAQLDAQFLAQLATQRLLGRLIRIELAAGEFPVARHVLAFWPLRDQYPSGRVEQHRRDHAHRLAHLLPARVPWQCLYFLPEPHGQGSLRPTLRSERTKGATVSPGAPAAMPASGCPALGPGPASGSGIPSKEWASACWACSARMSRSRRSASSRSICSWVRTSILVSVETVSNLTRPSMAENSS